MSEQDLESLAPDVQDLVDAEKQAPRLGDAVHRRILNRVQWTVAVMPSLVGEPNGHAAPTEGATIGAIQSAAGSLTAKYIATGLVAFSIGGGVGAGLRGTYVGEHSGPPPVTSVPAPRPGELSAVAPPIIEATASPPPASSVRPVSTVMGETRPGAGAGDPHPAPSASAADAPVAERDRDLGAERSLLEVARTALARGQSAGALDSLQKHAQQFPRGRLTEEREVLWIQALATGGRMAEARERAERFRRSFPRSMALPAIAAVVGSN